MGNIRVVYSILFSNVNIFPTNYCTLMGTLGIDVCADSSSDLSTSLISDRRSLCPRSYHSCHGVLHSPNQLSSFFNLENIVSFEILSQFERYYLESKDRIEECAFRHNFLK